MYPDGEGFVRAYPMKSKSEVGQTLKRLIEDVEIPNTPKFNSALEQVRPNTDFLKLLRKYSIKDHRNEAET